MALVPAAELGRSDGDPFLGTTIAGRFVIIGRLGAGSMGTVYRARQEAMGRDVAVKILRSDRALDEQAKARFSREARAMSLLSSPHTVTVFDFGEIPAPVSEDDDLESMGSSLYLAMELLEGESLGERLRRMGRLPVAEAVRIARHALLSLAEAHEKGVIHRDLKPDNLFLAIAPYEHDGERLPLAKVLDFGIAKIEVEKGSRLDALETQAGTVFGTPRYMSPEQAQGRSLDARSDLYALGVILYQMLVGRPPFVDDDAVVVMAKHIQAIPSPPEVACPDAAIGPDLSKVVMQALAKDPRERPADAREMLDALDRAAEAQGAMSRRSSSARPLASVSGEIAAVVSPGELDPHAATQRTAAAKRHFSRSTLAGALLFLVLAGVAGVTALRQSPEPAAAWREQAKSAAVETWQGALAIERPAAPKQAPPAATGAEPLPVAAPEPVLASAPLPVAPPATARPAGPRKPPGPRRYRRFE